MLDIGLPELAIVAVVVLIVIGPKELPAVLRGLGRWAGKAGTRPWFFLVPRLIQ